ncbi:MAG TPA: stage II sporulation protein M [Gemmataceae bacterium]|nr:stage II sporulation protein M [Gemmataceae bacterium]
MNLTQFIDQRRPQWRELQQLLETVEGSGLRTLDPDQAVQFATLYRRAASDLNQAQTFITGEGTVQYLNDLVARCYFIIHARRDPKIGSVLRAIFLGYPAVFRRCLPQFLLATALFFMGAIFGYAASTLDSKVARGYLLPTEMPTIEPGQERATMTSGQLAMFSGFLFRHNVSVTLVAFALGLTFGLGTIWLMFENGLMMGALGAVFVEAGATMEFCTGILPHGVLEIPACLLGGASGFVLAEAMLRTRPWSRLQELRNRSLEALALVAGALPLLAAAAFIEAVIARAPDALIDHGLKLVVALVAGGLFVAYLVLVGWLGRRATGHESAPT